MKKIVSFLCAACLVAVLSVPVFAATATGGIIQGGGKIDNSATNGQATPPSISDLKKDLSNQSNLAAAVKAFVDNKSMFLNSESTSILKDSLLLQSGGSSIAPTIANNSAVGAIVACAGAETANAALTVANASMTDGMLELDMTYLLNGSAAQPTYGVLITSTLKTPIAYDSSKAYIWKNDVGMSGIAMPIITNNQIVGYEFVASHFSKYTIGALTIATPPAATPDVVAPAKTGADNNVLAIALIAAGACALVGVAIVNGKKVSE